MSSTETLDDESRLAHAIAEFVELAKRGAAPKVEAFVARYTDIAEPLRTCLGLLTAGNPSSGAPEPVPRRVGDFRILRELGRGGMGVVYEAEQVSLPRRVALKVLAPGVAGASERMARFRREIEATARLQHPNIVPVFEAGEASGLPYYAMPLLDGASVDRVLRDFESAREPTPLSSRGELVAWIARFIAVARALHVAHEAGILHRDIKPSNLFLERDGRLTILDFGLARSSAEGDVTRTGEPVGTPRYMSPEQILVGQLPVDGRTDQFSLAATLYEVLIGRPAFRGEHREAVFRAILAEDPPSPRRVDARVPRDLEVVLLKALDKSPARRYSNLAELADDLQRFLDYEPLRARPVGPLGRAWRKAERNPAAAAALAVGVLASLSVLVASSVKARERGLRLADHLAQAEERMQARDFAAARDVCLKIEELDPSNPTAANLERAASLALLEEARAERVREAERHAAAAVETGHAARARLEACRGRLNELELELAAEKERLPPWARLQEKARVFALEHEIDRVLLERDQAFREALAKFASAEQLVPSGEIGRPEMAALAFDEYRTAERRRERDRAASLRALVEAYRGDDFQREWEGVGSLAIQSEPPGAEVFLFQYQPKDALLVPVPCSPQHGCDDSYLDAFDTHGPWVWVHVNEVRTSGAYASSDGLRAEDDILLVCGRPPASVAAVTEDLNRAHENQALHSHLVHVRRDGGFHSVELPIGSSTELSGEWHRDDAFPLPCGPFDRLGQSPLDGVSLPMGSYLVVLRLAGHAEVRAPFEISRLEDEVLSVPLYPHDRIEPDMLFVPGGAAPLGHDPGATESLPRTDADLASFFIQRLEVTFAEYFEFLSDLYATDPEQARQRRPRQGTPPGEMQYYWQLSDDGQILPDLPLGYGPSHPVIGVCYDDAQAYCAWMTRRRADPNVRFELPTEMEWEKAARGADARLFTWGNTFDWTCARLGYSTTRWGLIGGGLYPTDESAYGVLDMNGNAREWCQTPASRKRAFLRGGAYGDTSESYCHLANRAMDRPRDWVDPGAGFRIVQRIASP